MLTKIILLIGLLFLGNQLYTLIMQIDSRMLRELTSSIAIALILQPFVIRQLE